MKRDAISAARFTRNLGKEIVLTEADGYLYELVKIQGRRNRTEGLAGPLGYRNSNRNCGN